MTHAVSDLMCERIAQAFRRDVFAACILILILGDVIDQIVEIVLRDFCYHGGIALERFFNFDKHFLSSNLPARLPALINWLVTTPRRALPSSN
tara:strand:+ start:987 stop:1265 length:279 start_codon:yes stop_codon:yes gene_type:complete